MNKPSSVSNAVITIWVTLGVSALSAIAGRVTGQISSGIFFGSLLTYGMCAILPYKIGLGRNWARYFYAIVTAISLAVMLAGEGRGMSKVDEFVSWAMLPVEGWIIYLLFKQESGEWFEKT